MRVHFDQKALLELGQSFLVADIGVIEPLIVRPKAGAVELYEIVAGERRWRAAQLVSLDRIPCIVKTYTDLQALTAGLAENENRVGLNSFERARAFQMAVNDLGISHEECGDAFGVSRVAVTNHLRLFALPDYVQAQLSEGRLTESKVRCLHALSSADAVKVARQAVELDLSLRQIEALAKMITQDRAVAPTVKKQEDPDQRRFLDRLSERLGHQAEIEVAAKGEAGGYLKIRYFTMDDLGSITRKIIQGHD
jgi:ParB family chromosome partitioning protein